MGKKRRTAMKRNDRSKKQSKKFADDVELVTSATNAPGNKRFYEPDKLLIKFADKYRFRLRKNHLVNVGSKAGFSAKLKSLLADLEGAALFRMHSVDEDKIDKWVATARKQSRSKRQIGDLNNYYIILLNEPNAFEIAARFMELEEVEFARPLFKPVPPPQPGDYMTPNSTGPFQGYLEPAPKGIDAVFAWTIPGGDGTGVRICDIEYNWNFSHNEFTNNGGLVLLGNSPSDPDNDMSHGTAVVGVYGSNNESNTTTNPDGSVTVTEHGTKGIAFNVGKFACSVFTFFIYNISGAITTAMGGLSAGDILLIEQHLPGPNSDYSPPSVIGMIRGNLQDGFVPVEYYKENYDAIRTAIGNGFIVVESAGNGGENLDADVYHPEPNWIQQQLGIEPHTPFVEGHESGAILVGAGSSTTRAKLGFSNYGRRVDVQGWGVSVVTTTAPGSKPKPDLNDGRNEQYTKSFGGTSSASSIVAGACAVLQGVHQNLFGRKASPVEIRELLLKTNSIQTGNTDQHIGPLPDLRMAIQHLIPSEPWIRSDGVFPLPFEIHIASMSNENFTDVKVWYTLDRTDPVENTATLYQQPFELTESGHVEVRARTFATNSRGDRVSSAATRRLFRLYKRPKAPKNFRASQGTFSDHIRLEWDSIDHFGTKIASTYNVYWFCGSTNNPRYYKINNQPLSACSYDLYSDLAPLVRSNFVVQGTKHNWQTVVTSVNTPPAEMITEFSTVAQGWVSAGPLHLVASKGEFTDHVLIQWDYFNFGNANFLSCEYFLYRSEQFDPSTASLLAHLKKTYETFNIQGHDRRFPIAAKTFYEDRTVTPGQTYYYWVKAKALNPDDVLVETPLSNGDSGYMRIG